MKRILRSTYLIIVNVAAIIALYYGLYKGFEVLKNVALFWIWSGSVVAFILVWSRAARYERAKEGRSIPAVVKLVVTMCSVVMLAGQEYYATATAAIIGYVANETMYGINKKEE